MYNEEKMKMIAVEAYVCLYYWTYIYVKNIAIDITNRTITIKINYKNNNPNSMENINKHILNYIESLMCKLTKGCDIHYRTEQCNIEEIEHPIVYNGVAVEEKYLKNIFIKGETYKRKERWCSYSCGQCFNSFPTGRGRVLWCGKNKMHTLINKCCCPDFCNN
ncbi:MAG: hypothetical protein M0P71_01735 [Melioribacteraceae bacterium]|nr:hypothetical protein [Melioribacteraceae bacterium]